MESALGFDACRCATGPEDQATRRSSDCCREALAHGGGVDRQHHHVAGLRPGYQHQRGAFFVGVVDGARLRQPGRTQAAFDLRADLARRAAPQHARQQAQATRMQCARHAQQLGQAAGVVSAGESYKRQLFGLKS